jgi:hypothetical protein
VRIGAPDASLTASAGVAAVAEADRVLGLVRRLDEHIPCGSEFLPSSRPSGPNRSTAPPAGSRRAELCEHGVQSIFDIDSGSRIWLRSARAMVSKVPPSFPESVGLPTISRRRPAARARRAPDARCVRGRCYRFLDPVDHEVEAVGVFCAPGNPGLGVTVRTDSRERLVVDLPAQHARFRPARTVAEGEDSSVVLDHEILIANLRQPSAQWMHYRPRSFISRCFSGGRR